MKIDNFVRIVGGVLQTHPPIDAFERVIFDASRTTRGDLFIDAHASLDACQEAITKGAYAILSPLTCFDKESELAWVHTEDLDQALIRLLRYSVAEKSLHTLYLPPIQASLFEMLHTPKRVKMLKGSLVDHAIELLRAKKDEWFGFSDAHLCDLIAPLAYKPEPTSLENSTAKGLFLSSFWHLGHCYTDQKIPALFVPELCSLLHFCDTHGLDYALEELSWSHHFYPQFVTTQLRKKEFGSSEKVLIFEPSLELLAREIAYMQTQCNKTQWTLCLPRSLSYTPHGDISISYYHACEDLLLVDPAITYLLILAKKETFEPLLNQPFIQQPSLF